MKIQLNSILLALSIGLLGFLATESLPAFGQSDPELEQAQARVAQAMNAARKNHGSDTAVSHALGSLNHLVNERQKESEGRFFGKVFDGNGNVIGKASDTGSPILSGTASTNSLGRDTTRRPASEEYVLDGSKIKKEMVFGKPSKKRAPKP